MLLTLLLLAGAAEGDQNAARATPDAPIVVVGRQEDLTRIATSTNQGTLGAALALRPTLRPGKVLSRYRASLSPSIRGAATFHGGISVHDLPDHLLSR